MTFVFVYSGGISTYRELCSIANDLNQPDLIYKFMHLANHNAMWNSRKVARAFEFYNIIRLICVNIHATDRVLYEEWVYASFSEWIPKVFLFTRTILRRKILPPICHCLDVVWNNFCIKLNVHIEYHGFDFILSLLKGAAFGFSTIAAQAGEQLQPFLSQIIPKLYRYQFDPNPRIQQAMGSIWNALVKDNKNTVREQKYTCKGVPDNRWLLYSII